MGYKYRVHVSIAPSVSSSHLLISIKMKVLSILALCAALFLAIAYASPTEDEELHPEENESELLQSVVMEDKAVDQARRGKPNAPIRVLPRISRRCRRCCILNLPKCRRLCRCLG